MTREITDGAEWSDLLLWTGGTTGSTTISSLVKRSGNYSYSFTDVGAATSTAVYNFTAALSEFFLRFGLYINGPTGENTFLRIRTGSTVLGSLRYDSATSLIKVYRGDGTLLLATASASLLTDTWGRIEIHWKIAESPDGVFDLKIDGNTVATFTGDTKPGADTTATNIQFVAPASIGTFYIDDIALNTTAGGSDNSWCDDGQVLAAMKPNADGDTTQWTNSDGNQINNFDYVNNIPPGVTYIANSTAGESNLMNLESLDITGYTVLRGWIETRALDTVGPANMKLNLKTGGSTHQSGNLSLTTSSARKVGPDYTTNPTVGGAWTQAQLDALQIGPETV